MGDARARERCIPDSRVRARREVVGVGDGECVGDGDGDGEEVVDGGVGDVGVSEVV